MASQLPSVEAAAEARKVQQSARCPPVMLGTYSLGEHVFDVIPQNHPLKRRHREVEKFSGPILCNQKQRWNPSCQDEEHPFPQPALMFTNSCYNGVDVVTTHFPETIKGTTFLRVHMQTGKPGVWKNNQSKAVASNRYRYQCPALDEKEPSLSYLAQKIVEDNSEEKRRLATGWHNSAILDVNKRNLLFTPDKEPDYVTLNRGKKGVFNPTTYIAPYTRVKGMNAEMRETKRLQKVAHQEDPASLFERHDAPKVFKMSNAAEWWPLSPPTVASEQTARKIDMSTNRYSSFAGCHVTRYAEEAAERVETQPTSARRRQSVANSADASSNLDG